jgi:hypothetical protein
MPGYLFFIKVNISYAVTYNSRSRQFIILDSKGITAWSHNSVINAGILKLYQIWRVNKSLGNQIYLKVLFLLSVVTRLLDYPSYQFNLIQLLLHSKKFNVYFGLSKDYALKVGL